MVKFIINWEIIFDIVQLVGYLQGGVDCTLNEEKKLQTTTASANGNGLIAYTECDLPLWPGMVTRLLHDGVWRYSTAAYISGNRGQGF